MKTARAKVVKGKIITRTKFPEGARLTILMDDTRPPVRVDAEDRDAILKGSAEIKAGRGIPLDKFLDTHRRS
jgi:hypothetical protein